jgi:antitoxin PrlF
VPSSTVTSKGQITIPAHVRSALGLDAGDRVEFVEMEPGKYAIVPSTGTVRQLRGLISRAGEPVSIEQMNAAIRRRGAGGSKPR